MIKYNRHKTFLKNGYYWYYDRIHQKVKLAFYEDGFFYQYDETNMYDCIISIDRITHYKKCIIPKP